MGAECDGGGNRYLSAINLANAEGLRGFFPGKKIVQAGVCSLRLRAGEQPWIVCPRRLLSLRVGNGEGHQNEVKSHLMHYAGLDERQKHRAWSEVKMKVQTKTKEAEAKSFDYTFDYVVAGSRKITVKSAAALLGVKEKRAQSLAEENKFTLARRESEVWIDDAPGEPIVIVEIMTSSTSGGDKKKRTQIGMAFEDAVKGGGRHEGPGINYRQVWARMVSQLIVKSQVSLAWGGKTFWVLQDVLTDYILSSTALNLKRYVSEHANEVNLLALGYGDVEGAKDKSAIIEIKEAQFFSGPIVEKGEGGKELEGFIDIVKIGAPPPQEHLWRALLSKKPAGFLGAEGLTAG